MITIYVVIYSKCYHYIVNKNHGEAYRYILPDYMCYIVLCRHCEVSRCVHVWDARAGGTKGSDKRGIGVHTFS